MQLDSTSAGIFVDQRGRRRLSVVRGKASRLLHSLGVEARDSATLLAFGGDARVSKNGTTR